MLRMRELTQIQLSQLIFGITKNQRIRSKLQRLASLAPTLVTLTSLYFILKQARTKYRILNLKRLNLDLNLNSENLKNSHTMKIFEYARPYEDELPPAEPPPAEPPPEPPPAPTVQLEESFEIVQAISQLCIQFCFFWSTRHCIQSKTRHNRPFLLYITERIRKRIDPIARFLRRNLEETFGTPTLVFPTLHLFCPLANNFGEILGIANY